MKNTITRLFIFFYINILFNLILDNYWLIIFNNFFFKFFLLFNKYFLVIII